MINEVSDYLITFLCMFQLLNSDLPDLSRSHTSVTILTISLLPGGCGVPALPAAYRLVLCERCSVLFSTAWFYT